MLLFVDLLAEPVPPFWNVVLFNFTSDFQSLDWTMKERHTQASAHIQTEHEQTELQ